LNNERLDERESTSCYVESIHYTSTCNIKLRVKRIHKNCSAPIIFGCRYILELLKDEICAGTGR
jgi:hypothetical protein